MSVDHGCVTAAWFAGAATLQVDNSRHHSSTNNQQSCPGFSIAKKKAAAMDLRVLLTEAPEAAEL